ncbi:MAG: hypothetical protein KDA60_21375, partial [Planctomycetales bacterium]|nr:hypothetical protein [Planctomycetales bacterium]
IGIGGPRVILAGDIGTYSVALQGVSNLDSPYVYFEFGIPEMGENILVYGLDYLDYTSGVRGDLSDGPEGVSLLDLNPAANTTGHVLTRGYAYGQQAYGFDGFNFNVFTYPGLRELNERAFEEMRERVYAARPDLREAGVLDDGPEGLDLIQPGLYELYLALGSIPDFITRNFIPFQFHVVGAATALTRDEFIDHASAEAEQLRLGILDDSDASPALLSLAADRNLFRNLFLASLEESGILLPDGEAPPIREDATIQSLMSVLASGVLLGPAGQEIIGSDLVSFFEQLRLQYGHIEDRLAPTDGFVPNTPNPIPVIPDFSDFDLGATASTHYEAFRVYVPWVGFESRAGLSPEFYISGFNFVEDEPELADLDLSRFLSGDGSATGAASITAPFSSDASGFLPANQSLPYTINFQNPPEAGSYVHEVRVVQSLDQHLDSRTFRLGDIRIGNKNIDIPSGRGVYQADIDFTETDGFILRVSAGIDLFENEVSWLLQAIDPVTGAVIQDPNRGLLPPNNALGDGFGFVSYTISADDDIATGDVITAQARVLFEGAAPEDTEIVSQTIDAAAPITQLDVVRIPGATPNFEIRWNATDDENGSGFKHVTLYVAENQGDFTIWMRQLTDSVGTEVFIGEPGVVYEFLALSTDLAGNRELPPLGVMAQDDGSGANLGSLTELEQTAPNYGIAPEPSPEPSTNILFTAAEVGEAALVPPIRQPEFATVLR